MVNTPGGPSSTRDVWVGIGLFLLCALSGITLTGVVGALGLLVAVFIIARRKSRHGIVKGLVIGVSIVVLLAATCFGFVVIGFFRINR